MSLTVIEDKARFDTNTCALCHLNTKCGRGDGYYKNMCNDLHNDDKGSLLLDRVRVVLELTTDWLLDKGRSRVY